MVPSVRITSWCRGRVRRRVRRREFVGECALIVVGLMFGHVVIVRCVARLPARSRRRSAARSLRWHFLPSGLRREGRNRAAGTIPPRRRTDPGRPQPIRRSNSKPPPSHGWPMAKMRKRRRSPVTRVVSTTATRRGRIRNFGAVTSSRTKVRHRHRCGQNKHSLA